MFVENSLWVRHLDTILPHVFFVLCCGVHTIYTELMGTDLKGLHHFLLGLRRAGARWTKNKGSFIEGQEASHWAASAPSSHN
jgi:hypothetical protein